MAVSQDKMILSRRTALAGLAALSTVPAVAMAAIPEPATDPLLDAITAWEQACDRFNTMGAEKMKALGGEDAVYFSLLDPPFNVLKDWNQPATTLRSAIAALYVVHQQETDNLGSPIVLPMMEAALAYFEGHQS